MSTFEKALKFTLQWEGGYSNHEADKGGATMQGITQLNYHRYLTGRGIAPRSVREIKPTEVRDIYCQMFWNPIHASALPPKLGIAYFDWAVNTGPTRAVKHLQACLGVKADGEIGPITLKAMAGAKSEVLTCFLARREAFYREIGQGKQKVFLKGWMNRLEALKSYLEEL